MVGMGREPPSASSNLRHTSATRSEYRCVNGLAAQNASSNTPSTCNGGATAPGGSAATTPSWRREARARAATNSSTTMWQEEHKSDWQSAPSDCAVATSTVSEYLALAAAAAAVPATGLPFSSNSALSSAPPSAASSLPPPCCWPGSLADSLRFHSRSRSRRMRIMRSCFKRSWSVSSTSKPKSSSSNCSFSSCRMQPYACRTSIR